jgi:hypothetical protein
VAVLCSSFAELDALAKLAAGVDKVTKLLKGVTEPEPHPVVGKTK